jgi:hypothetical protein
MDLSLWLHLPELRFCWVNDTCFFLTFPYKHQSIDLPQLRLGITTPIILYAG